MSTAGAADIPDPNPAGDLPPADASSTPQPPDPSAPPSNPADTASSSEPAAIPLDANPPSSPALSSSSSDTHPTSTPPATPAAPTEPANSGTPAASGRDKIVKYDFRHPALLAPSETRKLRLRSDEFARSLATRLSIYLRLEFSVRLASLETIPFRGWVHKLPNPTHFTLFKIEPLEGIGVLEMPRTLGLTIVDRLMGGTGKPVVEARDLTEIETVLLDQAVLVLLKEWNQHVHRQPDAATSLLGHENNGRFLQFVDNDSNLVVLNLEISLGEIKEAVHLAFPYETLEPLIRQLGPLVEATRKSTPQPAVKLPKWNPELGNLTVPIVAQWTGLSIPARQLTQLKVGDVLPVDARHANQVHLRLAKISKFIGRLGTRGGSWAVELTAPVPP